DEERRDAVDGRDLAASRHPVFETAHECVDHLAVPLESEEQRHVDVYAFAQAGADRGQPLCSGGDLDQQVRFIDLAPQLPCRLDGGRGVARERGCDLDRHEAVVATGLVVRWAQQRKRIFDVTGDHLPVRVFDGAPLRCQLAELLVVVGGTPDGLREDRRVRRDAAHAAFDPARQLTRGDPAALEVVEPGTLTELVVQAPQVAHQSSSSSRSSSSSFALRATWSPVNPNFSSATFPGAEAPNRSIETVSSAQRSQPKDDAASTASVGTSDGRTCSCASSSSAANSVQLGIDTTRTLRPSASRTGFASRHTATSDPVPMSTMSRSSSGSTTPSLSETTYAPARSPCACSGVTTTGTSWRVRTSAVGPSLSMATCHATAVSLASAGRMSRSPGMARIAARCSTGWCVGPSSPRPTESWVHE